MQLPKYGTLVFMNEYFDFLTWRPCSFSLSNTFCRFSICSCQTQKCCLDSTKRRLSPGGPDPCLSGIQKEQMQLRKGVGYSSTTDNDCWYLRNAEHRCQEPYGYMRARDLMWRNILTLPELQINLPGAAAGMCQRQGQGLPLLCNLTCPSFSGPTQ